MKRMGIDPYKELLKLVAERQNDDTDDVEVWFLQIDFKFLKYFVIKVSIGPTAANCIFCGDEFASLNDRAAHSKASI